MSSEVSNQPDAPETIWVEQQPEDGYCREVWYPQPPRQLDSPKYEVIEYRRVKTCKVTDVIDVKGVVLTETGCGNQFIRLTTPLKFCGFCGGRLEIA